MYSRETKFMTADKVTIISARGFAEGPLLSHYPAEPIQCLCTCTFRYNRLCFQAPLAPFSIFGDASVDTLFSLRDRTYPA